MFRSICLLTSDLLQNDVLIRSGLTAGRAHHSNEFLCGTPFNRAYQLESEVARDPMVLLSEEVVEDAQKGGDALMQYLIEHDGRYFVHFLMQYAGYRPEPTYAGMVLLERPGARIIDFVCQRLNKDAGSIRAKAEWLQAYWNETVATHGVFGPIEAGVTERYDSGGPTIAVRRILKPRTGPRTDYT